MAVAIARLEPGGIASAQNFLAAIGDDHHLAPTARTRTRAPWCASRAGSTTLSVAAAAG